MDHSRLDNSKYRSLRQWFRAGADLGEFIGIRFGYLATGSVEPEWLYYAHSDFDGIGAFADILRRRGAEISQLPQIKYYPAYSAIGAAAKHWPRYLLPRRPLLWQPLVRNGRTSDAATPPGAVAWHVFNEETSERIRVESRRNGFTVNTLLLKALADAIRRFLVDPLVPLPWMIPVNMRGGVKQPRDTDNHTSYIAVQVACDQPAFDVHHRILWALSRCEHWGNWHAFKLGRWLPHSLRKLLVRKGLCLSQWSLGAFSNLGEWDPDRRIVASETVGDWLFCPPALRSQMVAAGCVTFQGRLTITIQAHPELTTDQTVVRAWSDGWVTEVERAIGAVSANAVERRSIRYPNQTAPR